MKKLIHTAAYLAVILTVISAFFGCKTTGAAVKDAEDDYKVVDWSGKDAGAAIPEWIAHTGQKKWFENQPEFKDKHVVIRVENGKDLDALKVWAEAEASSQIALTVKRGIDTELGNMLEGAKDDPEKQKAVGKSTGVAAEAAINGFYEYNSCWTKVRFSSGNFEYRYYVIYVIDKSVFEEQIDMMLGKIDAKDAKEKENIKTIGDRLKRARSFFE